MHVKTTRMITLILTQQEADWLAAYTQNCLDPNGVESQKDFEMRKKFFKACSSADLEEQEVEL